MTARTLLIVLLRLTGLAGLCALVFVFCPFAWMAAIHERIGMGPLEYTPLLSYLTRTLSAMYAMMGGFLWLFSSDLPRYRPALRLFAGIAIAGGLGVTWLDAVLGLPALWTWTEGPLTVLLGVMVLTLLSRLPRRR
ncbi:MAG TPA: hypothetical protein ENN87_05375 [Phycisphaerales bacterium]|nr:hypothetical protein [Phycisphaerales bacterium]